jgi:hypothetical protein
VADTRCQFFADDRASMSIGNAETPRTHPLRTRPLDKKAVARRLLPCGLLDSLELVTMMACWSIAISTFVFNRIRPTPLHQKKAPRTRQEGTSGWSCFCFKPSPPSHDSDQSEAEGE